MPSKVLTQEDTTLTCSKLIMLVEQVLSVALAGDMQSASMVGACRTAYRHGIESGVGCSASKHLVIKGPARSNTSPKNVMLGH
jgi:hypothetical protein